MINITSPAYFGHPSCILFSPIVSPAVAGPAERGTLPRSGLPCFCPCGQHNCPVRSSASEKFGRRVARGNPELSGFPMQTKLLFLLFATGGPPGGVQRRTAGRQRRNLLAILPIIPISAMPLLPDSPLTLNLTPSTPRLTHPCGRGWTSSSPDCNCTTGLPVDGNCRHDALYPSHTTRR